jgi:hypothetical protein
MEKCAISGTVLGFFSYLLSKLLDFATTVFVHLLGKKKDNASKIVLQAY